MAIVKISDLPLVDSPVEGTDLFVVVQDNVTKKAYASDIQTYVGFEEIQTATAGQTVFNLTTMTYAAGANNLMVFVDGVNQYEGLAYQETDNNTVTFTQGLHVGAVVKFSTVQTQTSLVNSAGAVTFLQAGTGAVPRSVQSKERDVVDVKDFGAVGDGVNNDTAAIQAALNSGAKVVSCAQNGTYLVSFAGNVSVNSVNYRYCLTVPAGVTFDLQGSTIKQASGQNSNVVVINGTTDSAVINGVIDSNKASQTTPATGEVASILVHNATRPRVENIRAINNRQYAGRFLKVTDGRFDDLYCTDSDGDGWSFGIDGGWSAHLVRCFIDKIYAENCTQVYAGAQGNGAIFTTKQSNVGNVLTRNCAGGIKIQDSSEDTAFDSLTFVGQTNGSSNSGIKVQGNTGAGLYPKRIQIANSMSINAYGNGLYINEVDSVEIGSYVGVTNGTGGAASGADQYDVDCKVRANGRVLIGRIDVDSPGTFGARLFGSGAVNINSIAVKSPTGRGVSVSGDSSFEFSIENVRVLDGGAMTHAFRVTGAKQGKVGTIFTNAANSLSQARVVVDETFYNVKIDRIFLGSTDVVEGVVQLTNGATSTSVACGHVYRVYIGGASSYFQPIIQLVPWNSTAAALGNMRATVTDSSSGTGFTINHASAGASDYVFYKVLGWQAMTRPSA